MRAFFEALTLFFKAMALLIPELIPLVRLKVQQAVTSQAEAQYGEHRKRFLDALTKGDPNGVAAAFAILDEQLLSRGIGLETLATEHRGDLPGKPGQVASGDGHQEAGRVRSDGAGGDVDRVGGVPGPNEQVAVGGDSKVGPVQLSELMETLEGRLKS